MQNYLHFRSLNRIFAANFNALMKKNASLIGILMVVAGTLLLLAGYLLHHTTNLLLGTGLVLIIVGIIGYIQGIKRANRY
mgnify:CR=1 FL=1